MSKISIIASFRNEQENLDLFISRIEDSFEKLENLANQINSGNELLVNQIVEIYYQITNVSSSIPR